MRQSWPSYFLSLARLVATRSKDRSMKYGAVIVGPGREVRSTGYNGMPRGVNDDVEARHERPAKYRFTEHAERNAVYNAARHGAALVGCTIYVNGHPCADCARAIIQSGIREVVMDAAERGKHAERWADEHEAAATMFAEAGVVATWVTVEA